MQDFKKCAVGILVTLYKNFSFIKFDQISMQTVRDTSKKKSILLLHKKLIYKEAEAGGS